MGIAVMAKKKSAGESERRLIAVTLKGTTAWKAWLERASDHAGLSVAAYLDQAAREYAKMRGFNEPVPKR